MNKKPLITIVVAVYNGEKYLHDCIKSILQQTYKNLEIILVDDGSTDNSGKLCDEYAKKDNRIKVIHEENGGVSFARNNALSKMKGEYVGFMDQDDYIDENYVEYLYNLIEQNNAEISIVPNVIYATKNQKIYSEKKDPKLTEVWSGEQAACEMLYSKIEIGPWSKLVSKKLINENNISFPIGIFGGDGYYFSVVSFANSRKVAVGYKGIYYYRVDNYDSEMSKYRPRTLQCSIKAVDLMGQKLCNYSKKLSKAIKYAQWRVYVTFLNNIVASKTTKKYYEDYQMLIKYSRKYAYRSFSANVSIKRKIKDLMYFISPLLVAKINVYKNKKRSFNKGEQDE